MGGCPASEMINTPRLHLARDSAGISAAYRGEKTCLGITALDNGLYATDMIRYWLNTG